MKIANETEVKPTSWEAWAKSFDNADKTTLKFFADVDAGKRTISDVDDYMQSATTSTSKFAATLKTVAANIAIMIAVTAGIKLIAFTYDQIAHRQENLNEKAAESAKVYEELQDEVDSLNDKLETTNSRIKELSKMPNLTFVEQEELENLKEANEELERTIGLKEADANIAADNARKDALKALNNKSSYSSYKGLEDPNTSDSQYALDSMRLKNTSKGTQLENAQKQLDDYNRLVAQKEALDKRLNDMHLADPSGYMYSTDYNNLQAGADTLGKWIDDLKADLATVSNTLDGFKSSLDPSQDTELIASIDAFQDAYIAKFSSTAKTVTQKFNDIWDSEEFAKQRKGLEALAAAGKLTPEVLETTEEYRRLIDETGASAESVAENIYALVEAESRLGAANSSPLSYADTITELEKLSDAFSAMDSSYAKFIDKDKSIGFEDLAELNEQFKDVSGIEDYIKALQDAGGETEATQAAFDNLLNAYLAQTDILGQVNDANANLIQSYLSEQGVVNADVLVQQALAESHAMVAAEKYYNATASAALEGATANETLRILEEADAAGISKQYLAQLELAKIAVNGTLIDTASDIDQIINLANAAGASANALYQLAAAKAAAGGSALVDPTSDSYDRFAALEGQRVLSELENGKFDYQFEEIDSSKFKSAVYGGGAKANKSGGSKKGSGSDKSKKEPTTVDWIETLIDRTTEKIEKLQGKINDAANWKTKNPLTDTSIDEMVNKLEAYQSMYDEYMAKADSIGLPDLYKYKVQNGALEIEDINDENISKMVSEYQGWYDKAKSVEAQIDEVRQSVKELNVSKLDNIINDFDSLCSLMDKLTGYNEKLIEVRKKAGEEIYEEDYTDLIAEQNGIYESLEEEYSRVEAQLNKLIKAGDIKRYSEEWYKYQETLVGIKSSMEDCKDAVLDFREAIVDLRFDDLNKFADSIGNANTGLSTLLSILGDGDKLKDGMLTTTGLSALAIYAQQLSNAKQEAAEYAEAIKALTEMYDNGDITQEQYTERLYEYQEAQWSAVEATHAAREAILQLKYEAIDQEIEAFQELVNIKKEELDAEEALYLHRKKVQDQTKNIVTLEKKIAELSLSDDRADKAMKLQLEEELAQARQELADYEREHSLEKQKEALDKEADAFQEAKEKEKDGIKESLEKQDAVIRDYLSKVTDNYEAVYKDLTEKGSAYNMTMTEELTSPWKDAESAANTFSSAVTDAVSKINYDISTIDTSGLSDLINMLNGFQGGSINLGNGDFEDVTGQGTWHKNNTGDWYGNSNDDYVSDGYYDIKGQTYGFNEDGYMIKGWDDSQGDWYYFEPENGQMVKSSWRKSKKGDWYYLQSDGTMATSASIKAQNEDGYYLVDDEGMWDGKLVKKPDFAQYPLAYARGTKNVPHNTPAWINELGEEMVMRPTDDSMLVSLKAHDKVLKADWSDNLFDFASNPSRFISDHIRNIGVSTHYPEIVKTPESSGTEVSIGSLITVEGHMLSDVFEEIRPKLDKWGRHELPKQIRSVNKKY